MTFIRAKVWRGASPNNAFLGGLVILVVALIIALGFRFSGETGSAAAQSGTHIAQSGVQSVAEAERPQPDISADTGASPSEAETGAAEGDAPQIRLVFLPENPRPGEPLTVGLGLSGKGAALPDKLSAVLINEGGKKLAQGFFFPLDAEPEAAPDTPVLAAILAVPATAAPGRAFIRLDPAIPGIEGAIPGIPLSIGEREFVSEVIDLDQRNTAIRTEPDPQKTAESSLLWAILSRTNGDIYALEAFTPPVTATRRTSFYGDRRVYRYVNGSTDTSIHAGLDYGVPRGTLVRACAGGKVVLARSRIVTGNSVILEHLPGVYSLYYHLDSIAVEEGSLVDAGTLLGESGATGLATGPHLHWEIRVAGENADPDAFVARPVLDKGGIISKLRQ